MGCCVHGVVEGVPKGDRERVDIVADHIEELIRVLHAHHHGEDELLWDKLEQRAPACSVHVEKMKIEHAQVAKLLDAAGALIPVWRESALAKDRDAVAKALSTMLAALESHLGQEETEIVPIAAVNLSQTEWNLLGEHGRAATPRDKQFVQLGYMLASITPEQRAILLKGIPAPVKLLYRLIGKRQYEKNRAKVYGTAA
jgi:hemerythrin-like domain-containing protein